MATIAVGGFQHETNTFAPTKAGLEHFEHGGGWPPLTSGPALFDAVRGINLSLAGFIEAAQKAGHRCQPLAWANASPSAHVTRQAFEHVSGLLLRRLDEIGPVDAVRQLHPYVSEFLYTHVDTEGLMQGTDVDAIRQVAEATTRRVTAAGGISTLDEIARLDAMGIDAVVGMALYTGRLGGK